MFQLIRMLWQVVGSKMPQYRLFGDTVDVAGMMTITGEGELVVVFKYYDDHHHQRR